MNCSDWGGGQSMSPSMDSSVEELDDAPSSQPMTPTKTVQGRRPGIETEKAVVGNGGFDSCDVLFMKDDVSVHPARSAFESTNGLLRLTKLGPSLFLTWTPPPPFNAGGRRGLHDRKNVEKDKSSFTSRAVSLSEMRSIRRHSPSAGLQYILIVLASGLSFPPLYFHAGGVKEFFAILRNHALLVRSIEDPNVYFVNSVDVQNQQKEIMKKTEESERKTRKNETEVHKSEKKEKEMTMDEGAETKDVRVPVLDPKPDVIAGNRLPSSTTHLDTPARRRFRRYMMAQDVPALPPPKEDIVLEFTSSVSPVPNKKKEISHKIAESTLIKGGSPASVMGQGATSIEKEVQVVGPSSCSTPIAGNFSPSSMANLETPPRKRPRRSMPPVLPELPPPKEDIVLKFSPSVSAIRGKFPRKTVELILPPAERAHPRKRKPSDVAAACSRVFYPPTSPLPAPVFLNFLPASPLPPPPVYFNFPPTCPLPAPVFVHLPYWPGLGSSSTPCASPMEQPEGPPFPRTAEARDAAPSVPFEEGFEYYSRLFRIGGFREGVALPVSWRNRLRLAELSSEECGFTRRRREWWIGTCLSASVSTSIPNHVISLLFSSELFMWLMVDSGLTYRTLNALKNIDKYGALTCGDICRYLKTFFSKAIRSRRRWWARVCGGIPGGVVGNGNNERRSVFQLLANEQHPAMSSIPQPQRRPAVSEPTDNREKTTRRWVPRSARQALKQVFVEWGCRMITPEESIVLATRFQGNPDALQILQLFRNWEKQNRRPSKDSAEISNSRSQPATGCRRRRQPETTSQTQDAQQACPHEKKPCFSSAPVRSNQRWQQLESQPSWSTEQSALMAREALMQAFQDRGSREISLDEAGVLAARFQSSPSATQVQLLFGKWAQEKRLRDKAAEDAAKNDPEAQIIDHLSLWRQEFLRKKLSRQDMLS